MNGWDGGMEEQFADHVAHRIASHRKDTIGIA